MEDSTQWLKVSDFMLPHNTLEKNRRVSNKTGFDHCFFCGKYVADKGEKTAWVEQTTSGLLIPNDVYVPIEGEPNNYQGHNSQGCFPVGPECAKKVPGYVRYWKPFGGIKDATRI